MKRLVQSNPGSPGSGWTLGSGFRPDPRPSETIYKHTDLRTAVSPGLREDSAAAAFLSESLLAH